MPDPAVVLIHGLGFKVSHQHELDTWLDALHSGLDGELLARVGPRMAYYSDELHPEVRRVSSTRRGSTDEDDEIQGALPPLQPTTPEELLVRALLDAHHEEQHEELASQGIDTPADDDRMLRRGYRELGPVYLEDDEYYDAFLCDVVKYFGLDHRVPVNAKLVAEMDAVKDRPLLLVAHSLGTIVAYDVLMAGEYRVETLMTLGSPLGWVQDFQAFMSGLLDRLSEDRLASLAEQGRGAEKLVRSAASLLARARQRISEAFPKGQVRRGQYYLPQPAFPDEKVERWYNLYDLLDRIAVPPPRRDGRLAPTYLSGDRELIYDLPVTNLGPDAHSIVGYLQMHQTQELIRDFIARHD